MDSRSRMVREGCLLSGYVMRWPDSKQTDGQIDMQRKHTRDAQLLVRQLKFIAKNCMLVVSCSCFVFANIFLRKWHCHPRYDELERSYIDHPMQYSFYYVVANSLFIKFILEPDYASVSSIICCAYLIDWSQFRKRDFLAKPQHACQDVVIPHYPQDTHSRSHKFPFMGRLCTYLLRVMCYYH
jgi:hypothetical protein